MAPKLVGSTPVYGPRGEYVRVLFYNDGTIKFRIAKATPMVLSQLFVTGPAKGKNVIIRLEPKK